MADIDGDVHATHTNTPETRCCLELPSTHRTLAGSPLHCSSSPHPCDEHHTPTHTSPQQQWLTTLARQNDHNWLCTMGNDPFTPNSMTTATQQNNIPQSWLQTCHTCIRVHVLAYIHVSAAQALQACVLAHNSPKTGWRCWCCYLPSAVCLVQARCSTQHSPNHILRNVYVHRSGHVM